MKYGHPAECVCKRREGRWKERRKRDEKEKEKEWGVHPMIQLIPDTTFFPTNTGFLLVPDFLSGFLLIFEESAQLKMMVQLLLLVQKVHLLSYTLTHPFKDYNMHFTSLYIL